MKRLLQPRQAVAQMEPHLSADRGTRGQAAPRFQREHRRLFTGGRSRFAREIDPERVAVYPEYARARRVISGFFGVNDNQLLLSNGTDEAVQLLVNTYVNAGDEVLIPQPSYAMYRFYAEVAGAKIVAIPYQQENLKFPLAKLLAAITPETRAIFLANPNNPTGTAISLDQIEQILEGAPAAAVLVDEAYFEFCRITAIGLLDRFSNLFVCRTFSKAFGMAGLRLGCVFSDPQNLAFVRKAQSPYSVNVLALLAAEAAASDRDYVESYVREVLEARELLCRALGKLGVPFYESNANFVLLRLGEDAGRVKDQLRSEEILVRDRSYELPGCVRVTVGTKAQTERFLEALGRILPAKRRGAQEVS